MSLLWSDSETTGTLCSWLLIVNSGWIAMYMVSSSDTERCVTSAAGHSMGTRSQGSDTEVEGLLKFRQWCSKWDDRVLGSRPTCSARVPRVRI